MSKQLELFESEPNPHLDRMIYLNGSKTSFRCDCGCNVFKEYKYCKFRCNACEATYISTPKINPDLPVLGVIDEISSKES